MQLRNIKASFIFIKDLMKKESHCCKKINFKINNASFTIYKHTPSLLNVTGVKSMKQLVKYKTIMEDYYKQPIVKVRIDNTFFSKKDNKNIDIAKIYTYLKLNYALCYDVSYNQELFCGMFVKPKDRTYPTFILFRTASYTMMGGRSADTISDTKQFVISLIEKFKK